MDTILSSTHPELLKGTDEGLVVGVTVHRSVTEWQVASDAVSTSMCIV